MAPRWPKLAQHGSRWPRVARRWTQDGLKMAQRWPQDNSKRAPRWPQDASKTHLRRIVTERILAFMKPTPAEAPECPQEAPKRPQEAPRGLPDAPKMPSRGSLDALKRPQEASRWPQDDPKSIRNDNNNTETVACQAKCSTHRNLRCFWDHAGAKLAPRWPQNCFKLAPRSSKMVPRLPHVGLKICLCGQCIAQTRQDKAQYH